MDELKIEYVDINSIKPYRRNAKRHPKDQIEKIKASMQAVGNLDPIGVWRGEIVEGHGRWLAARELGMDKVPVIRLDMLTDEQRKYYGLAHNKITMESEFDTPVLNLELMELADTGLDLTLVGFDAPKGNKRGKAQNHTDRDEDPLPRLQHNVFDNFDRDFWPDTEGKYDIPVMEPTEVSGTEFLRFCDWKEADDVSGTIAHFYYDDYKFMTAWRDPDAYVDRLRHFKAVVAPDFSLYTDTPLVLQILSCYRRQWVGAYWQSLGLTVIPDVVWGEERSWEFCFDGIPQGGTVAVSAVGVTTDDNWNGDGDLFRRGYEEMMRRIKPSTILYYGTMIDGLSGNIVRIPSFYEQRRGALNERKINHGQGTKR